MLPCEITPDCSIPRDLGATLASKATLPKTSCTRICRQKEPRHRVQTTKTAGMGLMNILVSTCWYLFYRVIQEPLVPKPLGPLPEKSSQTFNLPKHLEAELSPAAECASYEAACKQFFSQNM